MGLSDPMEEPEAVDTRWASDGLHDGHLEADKYAREHPEA